MERPAARAWSSVATMSEASGTKERLLDAAERLIAEVGPEAISLRRVTEEAAATWPPFTITSATRSLW